MKIGFATVDFSRTYRRPDGTHPLGGAGHYRVGIVADALARHGHHDVTVGVLVSRASTGEMGVMPLHMLDADPDARSAACAWDLDVVVLQRWMHEMVLADLPRARALGQVIVNDVDDHFDRLPPSNLAYWSTNPDRHPTQNREIYREILRLSSLVTVSTPTLADHYGRHAPTVLVRNALDLERWLPHPQDDPPRLGWVGAVLFRARDLQQLQGVVGRLLGDGYADQFQHSGSIFVDGARAHDKLGLPESAVRETPMAPIDDYPTLFDAIDVGVVPLQRHTFNDAKSCIKGMEYAASGIPFVASPTPEYRWLHDTFGIGRLATRSREWLGQLRAVRQPAVRATEAAANRAALAPLDIRQRWQEWESIYLSLLPTGVR